MNLYLFQYADSGVYQEIWQKWMQYPENRVSSDVEGLEKVDLLVDLMKISVPYQIGINYVKKPCYRYPIGSW